MGLQPIFLYTHTLYYALLYALYRTPEYIAPEVELRADYSVKADIWAVGIITYKMLLGRHPFNLDGRGPMQFVFLLALS